MDPSRENDPPGTQASLVAATSSSPLQSVRSSLAPEFTEAKLEFPSAFRVNMMTSGEAHASAEGDVLLSGVRLRTAPPVTGTTRISPPVRPASLINPSINATFFPSGETCG